MYVCYLLFLINNNNNNNNSNINKLTSDGAGVGRDDLPMFADRLHPHAVDVAIGRVGEVQQVGVEVERQGTDATLRQRVETSDEMRGHLNSVVGDSDMGAAQLLTDAIDVHRLLDDRTT